MRTAAFRSSRFRRMLKRLLIPVISVQTVAAQTPVATPTPVPGVSAESGGVTETVSPASGITFLPIPLFAPLPAATPVPPFVAPELIPFIPPAVFTDGLTASMIPVPSLDGAPPPEKAEIGDDLGADVQPIAAFLPEMRWPADEIWKLILQGEPIKHIMEAAFDIEDAAKRDRALTALYQLRWAAGRRSSCDTISALNDIDGVWKELRGDSFTVSNEALAIEARKIAAGHLDMGRLQVLDADRYRGALKPSAVVCTPAGEKPTVVIGAPGPLPGPHPADRNSFLRQSIVWRTHSWLAGRFCSFVLQTTIPALRSSLGQECIRWKAALNTNNPCVAQSSLANSAGILQMMTPATLLRTGVAAIDARDEFDLRWMSRKTPPSSSGILERWIPTLFAWQINNIINASPQCISVARSTHLWKTFEMDPNVAFAEKYTPRISNDAMRDSLLSALVQFRHAVIGERVCDATTGGQNLQAIWEMLQSNDFVFRRGTTPAEKDALQRSLDLTGKNLSTGLSFLARLLGGSSDCTARPVVSTGPLPESDLREPVDTAFAPGDRDWETAEEFKNAVLPTLYAVKPSPLENQLFQAYVRLERALLDGRSCAANAAGRTLWALVHMISTEDIVSSRYADLPDAVVEMHKLKMSYAANPFPLHFVRCDYECNP